MRRTRHHGMRRGGTAALAAVVFVGLAGTVPTGAAPVPPGAGTVGSGTTAGPAQPGLTQKLAPIDVNGGYVAAGTGLRNRGYGLIHIAGVPTGSTVARAYLYWTVDGGGSTPGATFNAGNADVESPASGGIRRQKGRA